ncbi:MAG: ABC transporter permease [Patescibacteria group bacterium]|nr:ABC transporter permease [Patescibacteria group bacterium]MBU1876896.1 ABC transporter permease [Patescibacteria group bacterium]
MKFTDYFKTAIIGIKTNKSRAFLTLLGIVIGISSVMTMISIGGGAQNLIISQVASFGSNNIFIEPGPWSKSMEKGQGIQSIMEEMQIKTLKYEDALAIAQDPLIDKVAAFVMGTERVIYKDESKKVSFFGTTEAGADVMDAHIEMGLNITDWDVKSMARKIVLGSKLKEDLFEDDNPIGKTVRIKKTNFTVIGVLAPQGTQMFMNLDEVAYIPLTTAQKLILGRDSIQQIIARTISEDKIDEAVNNIRLTIRERHNIDNPEGDLAKDDFKVMSQKQTAQILSTVTNTITVFLSAVASIALLVGGIGIMNIMLVSVTERTREIGLRKAVGAQEKDILWQFLIEAVVLTLLGGAIGIFLGFIASFAASQLAVAFLDPSWKFIFSLNSIILAFSVSTIIGLIFGIYPAQKAAKLSPIDALDYE